MPLVQLEITRQERFASGMEFGDVGTYELLHGIAHYEMDPKHPANSGIVDHGLASTNQRGQVEYEADFVMLHPTDQKRGNGAEWPSLRGLYSTFMTAVQAATTALQHCQEKRC